MTDPRVRALREQLARARGSSSSAADLPSDSPDDVFDDRLAEQVKAFQQARGLIADGVVGPHTARALDAAQWRLGDRVLLFTPGHLVRGDDVAALQERLQSLGLLHGLVDGVLGPDTDAALRDAQRSLGLAADGLCGPATLRGLAALARSVGGGDPWSLRQQARVEHAGKSLTGRCVVLDPGSAEHEADVTLDVARRVEGRLEVIGVRTVLSRGAAGRPDDAEVAELADDVRADVLLSLHCDRSPSPRAHGVAAFYWGDERVGSRSRVGQRLATLVQRELVARTGLLDCRTHARGFELLRRTPVPAVWVDLGYVTHPGDRAVLADRAARDRMADGVVAAVQRLYLGDDDAVTGTLNLADLLEHAGLAAPEAS